MTASPDVIDRYGTLCETVATEEIQRVLELVFYGHENVLELYSTRDAFSSLLDWMPVNASWKRAAIVLLFRMEAGRTVRTPARSNRELVQLLGRSLALVAPYANSSSPFSYAMLMREAHRLTGGDRKCITEGNLFRSFGMVANDWLPFARAGIRTLDRLLDYSAEGLLLLPDMGAKRVKLIERLLDDRGMALKS